MFDLDGVGGEVRLVVTVVLKLLGGRRAGQSGDACMGGGRGGGDDDGGGGWGCDFWGSGFFAANEWAPAGVHVCISVSIISILQLPGAAE